MKLHSSFSAPQKPAPTRYPRGWRRRLWLSSLFSVRTAWWVLVAIIAAFAITVIRMFRHVIELAPQ